MRDLDPVALFHAAEGVKASHTTDTPNHPDQLSQNSKENNPLKITRGRVQGSTWRSRCRRSNHVGFLTVLVRGGRRTIELGWVTHLVTHINPVPDTPALPASPSDDASR